MESEKLWNSNYTKVWCANFMIFFSFMLLTPLLPLYLSDTFHANKHVIGIVLSGYTIMALIARAFSGYIVDSFPRKIVLLVSYFFFFIFFSGYIVAGSLLFFAIVRTFHGAPFGATTVANSTVAIDVLPSSRRAEGIGYYGLSNNLATAISPSVALWIFNETHNYNLLFITACIIGAIGFIINSTITLPKKEIVKNKQPISLDRFFLLKGWSEALCIVAFAFSYGVISTYVAIYGKEELGITGGTGFFFTFLAVGLILSRLVGGRTLRKGRIIENASIGCLISLLGFLLFAFLHNEIGFYGAALIIGLGNGHMWPAFQNMFINLAPNSQRGTANSSLLVSWDVGIGLGIMAGGSLAEYYGYHSAFWWAWIVNLIGVVFFYVFVRNNYQKNKLR
ncbi:MAG: MFS transporter [Bacteroidales bacterium]|nr:MFS transporter [Bacteroidales bacterium]